MKLEINNLASILLIDANAKDVVELKLMFVENSITNPLIVHPNCREALDEMRGINGKQKMVPSPGIIFLDKECQDMNSAEFLTELENDPSLDGFKVFILYSKKIEQDEIRQNSVRVEGYIIKPLTFESFITVTTALRMSWVIYGNGHKKPLNGVSI